MMSRTYLTTPCPTNGSSSDRLSINAQPSIYDDTTTNIEYTRAFEPPLKASKPRRSSMFPGKAAKKAPLTIFEDVLEDEELVVADSQSKLSGKTSLYKPARKPVVAAASSRASNGTSNATEQRVGGMRETGQGRSRASLAGNGRVNLDLGGCIGKGVTGGEQNRAGMGEGLKKEARRRTIFMPSEDTTMLTIHPGAHPSNRLDDTFQLGHMNTTVVEEPTEAKQKDIAKPGRRPRKSLAVAPRRIPLQQSFEDPNNQLETFDLCGDNTGKENIPPMAEKMVNLKAFVAITDPAPAQDRGRRSMVQPTAASTGRQSVLPRTTVPITASVVPRSSVTRPVTTQPRPVLRAGCNTATRRVPVSRPTHDMPTDCNQTVGTKVRHIYLGYPGRKEHIREHIAMKRLELEATKLSLYPVLPENVEHPELYEDSWLGQQEVALTEVVNGIFIATNDETKPSSTGTLRKQSLEIYHQPEVSMLHKRLQASLLYGALSKPKTATTLRDLSRDIGLRKRFMTLWLDSYDEDSLRTAAETVVGRQVPRSSTQGAPQDISKTEHVLDPHAGRRALTRFLETFFAAPVDIDSSEVQISTSADVLRWRKTMLRSLMLVWLLDNAKSSGIIRGCLFKRTAVAKSSIAVLHELSNMLMPSVGDVTRSLKQMDYQVHHLQDPLDEVKYRIDNMAVDLRDGVLLTHLVEVLLYNTKAANEVPGEITITLPDTTILTSECTPGQLRNIRMLSQHLKMPAIGHAQKTFNVQLALSALEGHDIHAANVVGDITAEDIVVGHREKTLSLLWSLVSVFGLKHLLDWKELAADIQRHGGSKASENTTEQANSADPEALLLSWASAYASKGDEKKVTNLTTSFADGEAYVSIIDGFSAYMPNHASKRASSDANADLEARLEILGCSKAFARQLASAVGNIPSRETTISNLAFLASRLLPLARRHHAAATIQRALRQNRARIVASQRVALMRMARDCATVVLTGQRINAAATTIQRAWRSVLDARLQKMSKDLTKFQTLARGWSMRRATRVGGSSALASQRVRGGW